MRILITRPEARAKKLADLLQLDGHDTFVWPALNIEGVPVKAQTDLFDKIQQLATDSYLIFVSPNAVKAVFDILGADSKKLKYFKVFAVGNSTAKALAAYDINAIAPYKTKNSCIHDASKALLAVPELHQVEQKQIFIFRAQAGRELLPTELTARGAKVNCLTCYLRLPNTSNYQALTVAIANGVDVIICTSFDGLTSLWQALAKQNLQSQALSSTITVMSKKMLLLAERYGFAKVILLDSASNQNIVEQIK